MHTYHKTITDEEALQIYSVYSKLYRSNTGKKLSETSIAEALKEFTFDDMFLEYLSQMGSSWTEEEEFFWEENMDMFDTENYFVPEEKQVREGAWIKVRSENGYEIHWAKRSMRKRRWEELRIANLQQLSALTARITSRIKKDKIFNLLDIRAKKLQEKALELGIRQSLVIAPYEVKIRRSKTAFEYLLPYQYEIVDVDETIRYFMTLKQVTVKTFYNADNRQKIFYIRSRGIPEKLAIILSSLKDCYFMVNMEEIWNEFNNQWNITLTKTERK